MDKLILKNFNISKTSNNSNKIFSFKTFKHYFDYIGKLISSAVLVLLMFVGCFLTYYVVSAKILSNNPSYAPKFNLYTIVSGSMVPNIDVYDVVLAVKVNEPEDIKIGDVITFRSNSTISKDLIVTHRVINIVKNADGSIEYVTKGDYNTSADGATCPYNNIIGKVNFKLPQLGRVQYMLASRTGWFIAILLPALGIIIYDVVKILKMMMSNNKIDSINNNNNNSNNNNNTGSSNNQKLEDIEKERLRKADIEQSLANLKNMINNSQN